MGEKRKKKSRTVPLNVICDTCGEKAVWAIRNSERVLIRCNACGVRIFSYYADPKMKGQQPPPEAEDSLFVKLVEYEVLADLSPVTQELYRYLRRYHQRFGYAPTLREVQAAFGWKSVNTVRRHLERLEEINLIERDYSVSRGIRLVDIA